VSTVHVLAPAEEEMKVSGQYYEQQLPVLGTGFWTKLIAPGLCKQRILRKKVVGVHTDDREGECACAEMLPWGTKHSLRAKEQARARQHLWILRVEERQSELDRH